MAFAGTFDARRWIWSPRADLAIFGGSAAIALALVAGASHLGAEDGATPLWAWLMLVVVVDVGHVWSTLFRTYLDPVELRRRPALYLGVPLACFVAALLLHLRSDMLFWRVLAYAALFHFIRQQVGWVAIYRAKAGERGGLDRVIDDVAIYASTLYPVAFWHATPRAFRWFFEDDFLLVPALGVALPFLHGAWVAALLVYAARSGWKLWQGEAPNLGKHVVVATTAATWHVGIVATNSDFAFTAANVIVHGVPYVALLWAYTRERSREGGARLASAVVRVGVPAFLALLGLLAFVEELLWDRLVWHARPEIFGGVARGEHLLSPVAVAVAVAALAVPQATHYVLDAVLWRRSDTGPAQARALGFHRPATAVLLALGVAMAATAALGCGGSRDVTMAPPDDAAGRKAAGPPPSRDDGRLPSTVRPTRYGLAIVIDPAKERFTGDVTIDVELAERTSYLILHGRGISVLRGEISAGGATAPVQVEARPSAVGSGDAEELVVRLPAEQPPGPVRLHLAYSAALSEGLTGAFRVRDGEDWYAFTQFEPMDARRALPCFDEPGFKTPFDVKITVPKGQLAVSNMPEANRVTSEDGRRTTFSFDSSPPLPTYLLAFAVGPLEVKAGKAGPVPLRVVTTKGKAHLGEAALVAAAEQVTALSTYFDMPFPYPKLDLISIPEFGAGAMENAGLITFREDILLVDAKTSSPRARRRMETVLAHEIAHHWFGNLVTMAWWDDLWLNEGVATFFETRYPALLKQEVDPTPQLLARGTAMSLDALDSSRPVRMPVRNANDAEAAFDAIVYDKGARVVDMMEGWLGEEAFRDGIRRHVRAHPHGSATAADLFRSLGEGTKQDVAAVASTFLDRPGVPLVRAALACEGGGPRIVLGQSRYRSRAAKEGDAASPPWRIPVCVDFEGRTAPLCTLLEGAEVALPLPGGRCPRWIYPNVGERGYFRSHLTEAGFRALAKAGSAVDARQRFGALDNAWALVESGDLSVDVVLDVLEGLRRDRSRLVVERIAGALRDLDRAVVDDRSRPAFARFVAAQLLPIAKEVGWEATPGEPEDRGSLRRAALGALALHAPDRIMKEADPKARAFLTSLEKAGGATEGPSEGVDLETAGIALRAAARTADEASWERMEAALRVAKEPNERSVLLGGLASVGNPALLERSLELAITGNLRKQEAVTLLVAAGERSDARATVSAWLERRLPQLRAKVPTATLLVRMLDAVAGACEPKLQVQLARYLPTGMEGVDGADRRIDQVLEGVQRCVALRAREADRAAKRLP